MSAEQEARAKRELLRLLDSGAGPGDARIDSLCEALGLSPWSEAETMTVRAQVEVLRRVARGATQIAPHLLLAAAALGGAGTQQPSKATFRELKRERALLLKARVDARAEELSELQPDMLAEQDHVEADTQLKALRLAPLQRKVRNAVMTEMHTALQPNPPLAGDLIATSSWFRRSGVAQRRAVGISETAGAGTRRDDRRHRQEQEERRRNRQRAYLKQLMAHKQEFTEAYAAQYTNQKKIAREISRVHTAKIREEERKRRKAETDRIKALRENDEEGYLKLLQETKNTRLLHLIQQTDDYLTQIGAQIGKQKESARDEPEHEAKKRQSIEGGEEIVKQSDTVEAPTTEEKDPRSETDDAKQDIDPSENADEEAQDESNDLQGIKRRRDAYYTLTHTIKEKVFQPKMLVGGKLKPYQFEGLSWLISLYNNNLNGILADEMGLGKTIQTIALLSYLYEVKDNKGPFLIIVPLSTVSNWVRELEVWVPDFVSVVYKGDVATRRQLQHSIVNSRRFNVLLTTYEYTVKDKAVLGKISWKYIIIDEGHRMKNADSKLALTLGSKYQSKNRVLLTGTPLQNNLTELWALLNFLLPSIFSSSDTFETWFSAPFQANALGDSAELSEEESLLVINRLHQVLRPFLLRRLKTDVETQLPDKVERVVKCGLSVWQKVLYRQVRSNLALSTGEGAGLKVFNNAVMQMKKICNHPYLFYYEDELVGLPEDMLVRSSGKFLLLRGMLEKLTATNHRTLVFSQMTKALDLLEHLLEGTSIQYLRLDGTTKADDRRDLLEKFSVPGSKYSCFLLSTRAGGLGLNLQTADTVIIFDSDWNPQQDLQAQDRAHRIGQTQEVRVFRLICSNTIEEHVLARANAKLQMDAQIIQAGKFNQKSSDNERQEYLKDLFKKKEGDLDDVGNEADVITNDELNRWLARTEAEEEFFSKMDRESNIELSHDEAELPTWVLAPEMDDSTLAQQNEEILLLGRGRRSKKSVVYNDTLTEREWTEMVDEGGDPNAANVEKQRRLDSKRRRSTPIVEADTEEDSDGESGPRQRSKRKSVPASYATGDSDDDSKYEEPDGNDSETEPTPEKRTSKQRSNKRRR